MSKQIEFHEAAVAELDSAFDWYLAKSARVAAGFIEEKSKKHLY